MKKFACILVSLFFSINCMQSAAEKRKEKEKKLLNTYVEILLLQQFQANPPTYQPSACTDYSAPLNVGYPGAWPVLHADQTQYTTVIIGDSTMAIAATYNGFLGAGTQSVAISGNTACDMITQLPAINTVSPSVVIVATTGGNDLLRQISNSNILNTATLLVQAIHQKFPNAKLVMIAIHPTENSYANTNKATINTGFQNAQTAEYTTASQRCWYNPLPLFGVAEGQAAPTSDMLDSIHYNQAMTFNIKNNVQTNCGITY